MSTSSTSRGIVLITGASRGIGKFVALEFARRGYDLVLVARNLTLLEATAEQVSAHSERTHSVRVLVVQTDVRERDHMRVVAEKAVAHFGRIDIAVLNAGIGRPVSFATYDAETVEEIFETNVVSIAHEVGALAEIMRTQGSGVIAGVSSLADNRSIPGSSIYSASKAALSLMLETAGIELAPLGIRVVTVRPGFIRTDMTSQNSFRMPMLMSPERAAKIIVSGILRGRKTISFPFPMAFGSTLLRAIPRVEWRRLLKQA